MYLAHLEKLSRTRLEDVLVEEGVLDRPRVEDAQAEQEVSGRQLGEILIEREAITDYDLAKLVATHYSLPFLDVTGFSTRREVMELLASEFCLKYSILPLDQFGATITLAVTEMPSSELIDEIVQKTKLTPFLFVAQRRPIMEALDTEKKRGSARNAAQSRMTTAAPKPPPAGSRPAAAPAPAAPLPRPAAAAPTSAGRPSAPGRTTEVGDMPLPDLQLPTVSMKLVAGPGGNASKAPPLPARTSPARPATQVGVPRQTTVGTPPAAPNAAGALSWMDAAAPRSAATSGAAPASAPPEPDRPKISKFPFPSAAPGAKPKLDPRDTVVTASARPPQTPSPHAKPAAAPSAAAEKAGASPAWQSIFDVGEESVKREKPK